MAVPAPYLLWVKGFARKVEVIQIAERVGRDRKWVATTLMEFYEWLEDQTADGTIPALSVRSLSAFIADTDETFWRAVVRVGWLVESADSSGGLMVPNFERWMGKSAKRRWQDNERKRINRTIAEGRPQSVPEMSAMKADKYGTTEHNRTVSNTPPPPPNGGNASDEGEEEDTGPPGQTLEDIRGVARPMLPCDRPELDPVVKRIIKHYETVVASGHATKRPPARKAIVALLTSGTDESTLLRAADGYAALCREAGTERSRRHPAHNFYKAGGSHEQFLDYQPPAATFKQPKPLPPLT